MPGSSWKISYGDESFASGTVVGTDTIELGGLRVENQAIELADTLSEQFQRGTADGLLGLAFSNINQVRPQAVRTPVENMVKQNDIPRSAELFTAKLGSWRDADEPDTGESFYTFGFIDQNTVTASGDDVYYTDIDNSHGFWLFDSASATVNGRRIARKGNRAIADTGTTLALVDDATCQAIYDAIPGARYDEASQGYIYPNNTTEENLPVVSFAIGEKQFVVQKEDLGFAEAKPGFLYGGIQSRGNMKMDILGDTFLKGIYAVSSSWLCTVNIFANGGRYLMLAIFGLGLSSETNFVKICLSLPRYVIGLDRVIMGQSRKCRLLLGDV